jgi:hypothetical protein
MPLLGQASGGFTESSAALRILHLGVRNATGVLTADGFTQTNPPLVTTAGTISTQVNTGVLGVLSGSVAFTRPDQGSNFIGGPVEPGAPDEVLIRPLGCFVNTAVGNAFENQPGPASGKNTYVSANGTYGNALFETQALDTSAGVTQGDDLIYAAGQELVASRNGYLMMRITTQTGVAVSLDTATITSEVANGQAASTTLGILKLPRMLNNLNWCTTSASRKELKNVWS